MHTSTEGADWCSCCKTLHHFWKIVEDRRSASGLEESQSHYSLQEGQDLSNDRPVGLTLILGKMRQQPVLVCLFYFFFPNTVLWAVGVRHIIGYISSLQKTFVVKIVRLNLDFKSRMTAWFLHVAITVHWTDIRDVPLTTN